MAHYILKGIVHPERALITFYPPTPKKIKHAGTGAELSLKLKIINNHITIFIDTNQEIDTYTLRNIGRHYTTVICSTLSFMRGYSYDVEIIEIISEEKNIDMIFGIDTPCIANRASAPQNFNDITIMFDKIKPFIANESGLFFQRCLKDLNSALADT